jgi:hypothetical protein
MKKTAVQIAIENVDQCLNSEDVKAMLEGLLEIEKQQIIDAYKYELDNSLGAKILAEQYYNKTY